MKRFISLLLSAVMVLSLCTFAAGADQDGDFTYTVSDGKATITKYTGSGGDVVIPSTLGGYPVTGIGDEAFIWRSDLTSVTIPGSVTSIGKKAFFWCGELTSVTIPDSVTSIGEGAFFACSGLTSVTIPDGVTSIGDSVFSGCNSLTSVTIPDSVTSIGDQTFSCCVGLTSISIPDSVTSIGNGAFSYCSQLCSIEVSSGNPYYHSSGNCLIETESKTLILGCASSVIPDDGSVTRIGDQAFYKSTELTSVTIPDGVTSIGYRAFYGCTGLTSVTIPDSVTSIGDQAFYVCIGLTSVTIGSGVTSIGDSAFSGCESLTSVTIPDSVTSIGYGAFYDCRGLTSVTIPDGVTSIGDSAFYRCYNLTSVTIPDSVTSIGDYAFYNCTSLSTVNYTGSQQQWDQISKGSNNDPLLNAAKVFNYCFHSVKDHVDSEDSTCVEQGWDEHFICAKCGQVFASDGETPLDAVPILPLLPHTSGAEVRENEVQPACETVGGYDTVVYCSDCHTEISRTHTTAPALGHDYAAWTQTVAPTCTTPGTEKRACSRCGKTETREVAASGHVHAAAIRENEAAATCTAVGGYDTVVYCSVCHTELIRTHVTVPRLDHTPGETVRENEAAATCTAVGGYDQVVCCSVCHTELSRTHVTVPRLDHTPGETVRENEAAATYTSEGGYDEVVYCSVCHTELSRVHTTLPVISVKLVVESVSCFTGDTNVEVAVRIENNPGFFVLQIEKDFPVAFEYVGADSANGLINVTDYYDDTTGTFGENLLIESLKRTEEKPKRPADYTDDGDIFYFYFNVASILWPGDYTVSFNVLSANNYDLEYLTDYITVVPGTIHVSTICGDANGDRIIDTLDVTLLRQRLVSSSVEVSAGADVDASGTIDSLDITLMRNYLAGEDVTFGAHT